MLSDKCVFYIYDDVLHCEAPLPNLNSVNIFLHIAWGQTGKHQYFRLYGMLESVCSDKGLGVVYITIWLTRYTYLQCTPHMQISITFELTHVHYC